MAKTSSLERKDSFLRRQGNPSKSDSLCNSHVCYGLRNGEFLFGNGGSNGLILVGSENY